MHVGQQRAVQSENQEGHTRRASRGVSAADDALLRAVHAHRLLTVEQVTRLFYNPGSLEWVRKSLNRLVDERYLQRFRAPSTGTGGSAWVYTLARRSINYLKAAGLTEFPRFRPSEQREHSFLFLAHSLGVSDVLIAARLLEETMPGLEIAKMTHDWQLKLAPVTVTTAKGEKVGVVVDGYLDVVLRGAERMPILLEYDRGTMEQKAIKRKIRALLAYAIGPYRELYQTNSVTFAFATSAGAHRANLLKNWAEQELKALQEERHAENFLFTALPQGTLDPRTLFLSPVWQVPFASGLVPLIEW